MTDSVKGVSGTQGASAGGSYSSGGHLADHKKRSAQAPQADLVEISKDALERSKGKKRRSLLEYLIELLR